MNVATVNAAVKIGPRKWRRCWKDAAATSTVFGMNESLTRRQRALYAALAARNGWGAAGLWGPNPVFYRRRVWRKVESRRVKLHGRLSFAGTFPGFNAAREVTNVTLSSRGDAPFRIGFLCTHLVPNGSKVKEADRQLARQHSRIILARLVNEHTEASRPAVLVGDMNYAGDFELPAARRFKWVTGRRVTKIGVARPVGWEVLGQAEPFETASDHGFGVRATIAATDRNR